MCVWVLIGIAATSRNKDKLLQSSMLMSVRIVEGKIGCGTSGCHIIMDAIHFRYCRCNTERDRVVLV